MADRGDRLGGTKGKVAAMHSRGLIGAFLAAVLLVGCAGKAGTAPNAPAATETPTPAAPEVRLAGTIEFGTKYDPDTLAMTTPVSRFKVTYNPISYVIHLSEPAGATSLTLSLTRRASGGAETTIVSVPLDVANPEFNTFANSTDLGGLADHKVGTYVLRLIREGELLAEGTFELVK